MTNSKTHIISVVRDFDMYNKYVRGNPHVSGLHMHALDNTSDNKGIPSRYNVFLNGYNFFESAWFVFCHEDFEFCEPLVPLLDNLPQDSLYGPIGCARKGIFPFRHQVFLGQIKEHNRDGSGEPWIVGRKVKPMTPVETFDCCCLIVHSSLVQKHNLRFDEELAFDLYVEDFCAMAQAKHDIPSRILPFKAIHHSGSKPTDRLYRHLPYLAKKYPRNCFCASCTYFGTPPLSMYIQQTISHTLNHQCRPSK